MATVALFPVLNPRQSKSKAPTRRIPERHSRRHRGTAIHVVLDNLNTHNTHKPKNDRWLKRHPNVSFHFTPTRASWLNQVEIWFSILQGQSRSGSPLNRSNNSGSTSMTSLKPTMRR